ncbi:hypothetical protein HNP82_001079 [Catenibacillus scindens]|uniref:Uncharacterized protein n=1 Tax=Catenibacillus scindens TaxID=673271 RepID=A0A7W8H8Y0_9FIRM|nr:hypothetical protein [Catenibacillus scindens]MBB5263974.1 hypothetical protein [Catenibacillus scindens]
MKIFDCKTNHMTNPLGFYLGTPRVSWKVSDTEGKSQKNARIYVS